MTQESLLDRLEPYTMYGLSRRLAERRAVLDLRSPRTGRSVREVIEERRQLMRRVEDLDNYSRRVL